MRAVVIEPDAAGGRVEVIEVEPADDLRTLLGGFAESVPTRFPHTLGFVNEDGLRLALPLNSKASRVTDPFRVGPIVGRLVLFGAPDAKGDLTPVPFFVIQTLVPNCAEAL